MIATTRPPDAGPELTPEILDRLRAGLATPARPERARPRAPRDDPPDILRALAALPTATPTADELAEALRIPDAPADRAALAESLRDLERGGRIETWPDPVRPTRTRVMLSAYAAQGLGLMLSRRGDRWESARP